MILSNQKVRDIIVMRHNFQTTMLFTWLSTLTMSLIILYDTRELNVNWLAVVFLMCADFGLTLWLIYRYRHQYGDEFHPSTAINTLTGITKDVNELKTQDRELQKMWMWSNHARNFGMWTCIITVILYMVF